jgi:hypothetical protein
MWGDKTFDRTFIAPLLGEKGQAIYLLGDALKEGLSYLSLHAEMA